MSTLCAPTPRLICFGCCPPIRPSHYDPLDHARILKRELRENRQALLLQRPRHRPIVGYSCWGLGFLDESGRRAGCLLHPLQNDGNDLRHCIDYGNKCARELCVPARMFADLPDEAKAFWLPLAAGFTSFFYSSRRSNPLFHLVLWGRKVLEPLRGVGEEHDLLATELLERFTFLTNGNWEPRGVRFIFGMILRKLSRRHWDSDRLEALCRKVLHRVQESIGRMPYSTGSLEGLPYTHQLDLPEDLKDFIRLTLGHQKTSPRSAIWVNETTESWMERLISA